jgi:hypothetical protein
MIGQTVNIKIELGLETKRIKAVVLEYLGNGEYVVEGENGNRYIRKLEQRHATQPNTPLVEVINV